MFGVNVTPVPCVRVKVLVVVNPKSSEDAADGKLTAVSVRFSTNCPARPVTFVTVVSTSALKITLFGEIYFCVVDLWSKFAFGKR